MRCSSGKISDVSGAAAAGTNGEVHGWLVRRGDLWGCPGRPCLSQQGSRVLLGRRAEKRKARGQQTAGVKVVAMANEHQDLYETLGISATASDRDIKQAYRRLALRFHPDVNKEPDAQEKFLRIKSAYQTLSDPSSRIRYDAVRRRGDESWSPFGGWGSSGAKSKEDEEFYGLGEFFRDLENDLNKRQQEMAEGKGKSLWEELAELGEEFVEFLEKELTIPSPGQAQNSWGGASPNGSESEQRERSKTSAERVVAIDGDMVSVNYRCTTEDGKLLYASEEPISFEVGAGDVMGNPLFQGFDQASRGLAVGECSSFTVSNELQSRYLAFVVLF
ncbi:hypothetical protein CBR_g26305 [Chara braunii]|uniref:peptidylprolyl isomerase n=1 Tax=Chara braunii TaxID=69332 RepID=A0A388L7L5_CHABU|nr:hypothetical protein CBR_g26305 [Chara braunii]|eukprot:GBG78274.1 hypothetical protein CBR_g26305 [Chara braunii]